MVKHKISGILIVILFTAFFFALWYVLPFLSQPGIQVSCSQKSILGFKRVPPPLMAIVQPEICRVELEAKSDNFILCSGKFSVLTTDTKVFPCPGLNDFLNKTIEINANFYNLNDTQIGTDSKVLTFEGF